MNKIIIQTLALISFLTFSSSCIFIAAGVASGGSYYWYNGRLDKKLSQDKDYVYNTAIKFLESKGARITLKDELDGKIEGKLDFKKTVTKTVDGQEKIVEEIQTQVITFSIKNFKKKVAKDPANPTENEKNQMEKEKNWNTQLSFKVTDGVKPIQEEAKQYYAEFEKML